MTMNTPKRPNVDMSFSPEQLLPNKEYFKELFREVLDEKFKEYLKPVKEDISALQSGLKTMKDEQAIVVKELQDENVKLQQHIKRLEMFQRKNNLRLFDVPEEKNENLEEKIINLCNKYLHPSCALNSRSFERIHRTGPLIKDRSRTVIARLCHFKDKINIVKLRKQLIDVEHINIADDFSPQVEKQRKLLYPVMAAIRSKLGKENGSKIFLKEDQLIFKGLSYRVEDLHRLPDELNIQKLFTPTKNNITAFFTRHSMLSNHHQCNFTVNGTHYTSMEKFLFTSLARLFQDEELVQRISNENDPVEIKKMGKRMKNFDKSVWHTNIESILHQGLTEKFSQNPTLASGLLATGDSIIVEANKFDCVFGIGLALSDRNVWNQDKWSGNNLMGKSLMKVRDLLKQGK